MWGISGQVRRLRRAIERNQFRLVYQPKADMRTGTIVGVEALARWDHPRGGTITPSEFVPVAERRESVIQHLTDWTLVAAIEQACKWQEHGHDLNVAVNLSPKSALDPALPEKIHVLLERYDVTPARIQLELTETAVFASEPARVTQALSELAEMGIVIALDDFGTGYSSLSRLRDLPIHKVKIDQSFVSHMDRRPQDALIVRSVIALAKSLHLRVVAEGVESEPVWRRLSDLGCDMAQGHYLTRPVPPDELIAWVRQWDELYAEAHRIADELLERRNGPTNRRSGPDDRRRFTNGHGRFVPTRPDEL
jgi:EAL domain-containing protein (putative c-di-GMP-specific phosphodiesterase class I)